MIFDATKGDVAICDVAGTVRSGRISVERLGGVVAGSAASAVREIVTDPVVGFALSHSPNPLRLIEEPAADEAGKLATSATGEPTPADEATLGVGSCAGISSTA